LGPIFTLVPIEMSREEICVFLPMKTLSLIDIASGLTKKESGKKPKFFSTFLNVEVMALRLMAAHTRLHRERRESTNYNKAFFILTGSSNWIGCF